MLFRFKRFHFDAARVGCGSCPDSRCRCPTPPCRVELLEWLGSHPLTTETIRSHFEDTQVLGKGEMSALLKWRFKLKKEGAAPSQPRTAKEEEDAPAADVVAVVEDKVDVELEAVMAKISAEEKRRRKRERERKARDEWRKKASMTAVARGDEEPDLFSGGAATFAEAERNPALHAAEIRFLSGEGAHPDDADDEAEQPVVSSDDEPERLLQLELEMELYFEDKQARELATRKRISSSGRKKKETRRQRVTAAWAKEMESFEENLSARATELHRQQMAGSGSDDDDDATDSEAAPPPEPDSSDGVVASRWFSGPLFERAGVAPLEDDTMHELTDAQLPKLPLSDKQKRQAKRRLETERRDRKRQKTTGPEAEDDEEPDKDRRGPTFEIAPAIPDMKPAMEEPDDPDEVADIQAIGALAIKKRTRMDLIDGGFNKFTYIDDPKVLPEWFTTNEEKHHVPEYPVTKELSREYQAKIREIQKRPIRRVLEARGRKAKRAAKRMEKARKKSEGVAESAELDEVSKAKAIRQIVRKAERENRGMKDKVYLVTRRAGGSKAARAKSGRAGKSSKNSKVVDRRLKKDTRHSGSKTKRK
eukprot:Polyplicarium_translucidae@DN1988_c0_g1_i2.p1